MALAELRGSMSQAIKDLLNAFIVDENMVKRCVSEISLLLLRADVQFNLVRRMQSNIMNIINNAGPSTGQEEYKIIWQAIFNELCNVLDPGKPSFTPKKGQTSVVMFVGLQGSGKTSTCANYAYYHQKSGWKLALVCADTSPVAFDQLMQNAMDARIPFHGSYVESDPLKIAVEGVERFKNDEEIYDLIIINASGHHKHEVVLFEEMRRLSEATKPDLVVLVMDSSVGQAAFDQAQAFKQSIGVGAEAVILTKIDCHEKSVGAISAVTATKSPLMYIEKGENFHEFEVFDAKSFVSSLLGMGHLFGFVEEVNKGAPIDRQPYFRQYTLQIMYHRFRRMRKLHKIRTRQGSTPPGDIANSLMLKCGENESLDKKFKLYIAILESIMQELDGRNPELLNYCRIMRIAKCAGSQVREVMEILEDYKRLAKIDSTMKLVTPALHLHDK